MRVSDEQHRLIEQRIRAAADALLRGELPPSGKCDISTLAQQAQISRAALYRSYPHLKAEFEQRLQQLRVAGQVPDHREEQIAKLKVHNAELKQRIAQRDAALSDLEEFKTQAISRLAAQHDEIHRLQKASRTPDANIRSIHSRHRATTAIPSEPADPPPRQDLNPNPAQQGHTRDLPHRSGRTAPTK